MTMCISALAKGIFLYNLQSSQCYMFNNSVMVCFPLSTMIAGYEPSLTMIISLRHYQPLLTMISTIVKRSMMSRSGAFQVNGRSLMSQQLGHAGHADWFWRHSVYEVYSRTTYGVSHKRTPQKMVGLCL